jgi:hypothetical protein
VPHSSEHRAIVGTLQRPRLRRIPHNLRRFPGEATRAGDRSGCRGKQRCAGIAREDPSPGAVPLRREAAGAVREFSSQEQAIAKPVHRTALRIPPPGTARRIPWLPSRPAQPASPTSGVAEPVPALASESTALASGDTGILMYSTTLVIPGPALPSQGVGMPRRSILRDDAGGAGPRAKDRRST